MSFENESPVSWRELQLSLAPVKEQLTDLKQDVSEMRAQVHTFAVLAERRAFLGARGRNVVNGLLVSLPAALIAAVVSLIVTH